MLLGLGAGVLDMERSGPIETDARADARILVNVEPVKLSALLKRAEIKREKDRPSGLTRSHIEEMLRNQ